MSANFTMIKVVEAGLTAVGIGLLVQAAVMLAFDVFAEHRAHVYATWLRDSIAG